MSSTSLIIEYISHACRVLPVRPGHGTSIVTNLETLKEHILSDEIIGYRTFKLSAIRVCELQVAGVLLVKIISNITFALLTTASFEVKPVG